MPAAVFLVTQPRTSDFAVHVFRAGLFEREGFAVWNGAWYGGHHTPGYSALFPPLAAVLGPALVGAASAVAGAALFASLAERRFGARARAGVLWFAVATASMLFSGRLPFALGVALGLGALLALAQRRRGAAADLAVATGLASPVAALFLALLAAALALSGAVRRPAAGADVRVGIALAAAALAAPVILALAFPEGGHHPFPPESFLTVLAVALLVAALVPAEHRAVRAGALLYAAAAVAAFALPTPMGNNMVRLGALAGGPVLLAALGGRLPGGPSRRALAAATLAGLAVWQWSAPVRDVARAVRDPSAQAAYYRPLLGFLAGAASPADRIEIPFTETHWEAAEVAPRFPLARGWERQLDVERNALFYEGRLDDRRYEAWLRENGVRFVAVPGAALDQSAKAERALALRDPPYLAPRWRSPDWQVFEVVPPPPAALREDGADVVLRDLRADAVVLDVGRPGPVLVRVRPSPYWRTREGCVERAGEWTRVLARRPGRVRLFMSVAPARLLARGRRCG